MQKKIQSKAQALSLTLNATNVALVLAFATLSDVAYAQADMANSAAGQLLEKGILGTLCVIEGLVIFMLFREIRSGHVAAAELAAATLKQQTEWAVKATEVLSRVNDHLERNDRRDPEHNKKRD